MQSELARSSSSVVSWLVPIMADQKHCGLSAHLCLSTSTQTSPLRQESMPSFTPATRAQRQGADLGATWRLALPVCSRCLVPPSRPELPSYSLAQANSTPHPMQTDDLFTPCSSARQRSATGRRWGGGVHIIAATCCGVAITNNCRGSRRACSHL